MEPNFDLEQYLTHGVEKVVSESLKASFNNPKESIFMTKYYRASRKASKRRHTAEEEGDHIPPFLIASITTNCNLHCAGCYSRAINTCLDEVPHDQLDAATWGALFNEADRLGIAFIFLAGGEPLMRKDVIMEAAKVPHILFPIITNGTMLNIEYMRMFDQNRNLVPIISIEGGKETTDQRRGEGVYDRIDNSITTMNNNGIFYGVSITVTPNNMYEVLTPEFIADLYEKGCKAILYIEYVPAEPHTEKLAPSSDDRAYIERTLNELRSHYDDMVILAFPGDEKASGGCLAAGRGFFHINAHGGAEPCPFSPYSDINVKDVGIEGALHSKLFQSLKAEGLLSQEHTGGCVLYGKKQQVEALL